MRKFLACPLLAALLLALVACAGGGDMPPSEPPSSAASMPISSVAQPESVSLPPESQSAAETADVPFLNAEMAAVIGKPLSALEDAWGNDYFIYLVGDVTGALEYYNPYTCFYFDPMGYFNLSGLPENAWDPNPFATDELLIKWVVIQETVDPATGAVSGQDALRRLFTTDAPITYDLLAEKLGQTPALVYNPEGGCYQAAEYEMGGQTVPIAGGTYSATFLIGEWSGEIGFVKNQDGSQDSYLAHSITFGDNF